MNPLYRVWWRFLMDLRPMVRFLAERLPKLAPWGVRLRVVFHWIVGNPVQALAIFDGFLLWQVTDIDGRLIAATAALLCLAMEIYHRVAFRSGGLLVGWREAWRVRRRWPNDWAIVAAKTARVQAEVGTSKEPISSAVLRPVADHPKMSWLPKVEWPVVSWWVGPPPGRSLAALDELAVVLAANISHVSDVTVDYERENDSHGRLIMSFDDVLAQPSSPEWSPKPKTLTPAVEPLDDLDAAIQDLDQTETAYPPLRVIEGEAG